MYKTVYIAFNAHGHHHHHVLIVGTRLKFLAMAPLFFIIIKKWETPDRHDFWVYYRELKLWSHTREVVTVKCNLHGNILLLLKVWRSAVRCLRIQQRIRLIHPFWFKISGCNEALFSITLFRLLHYILFNYFFSLVNCKLDQEFWLIAK